jgi:dihydroorotase
MKLMKKGSVYLKGGHVCDPANGRDAVGDVLVVDGIIRDASAGVPEGVAEVDCSGRWVVPGLIDLHVHLREPGQSAKETIGSGTRAAAAGGFTTVVCMPNTSPAVDSPSVVTWILEKARAEGVVKVLPTGAITKGIAGEELAPIGSLRKAGVVAITDDGRCIQNNGLMRRALEYAGMFGLVVMDHCQDYGVVGKGVMHEGYWSSVLGLPGWPALGEELIVSRNAALAEVTGTPIHCQHLSAKGSVRILREARARGIPLSGELCPHHVALTDGLLKDYDTNFKMNPPLRSEEHVEALLEGVADGTITVLASDHAPHCGFEKEVEFDHAPFGILGLETELGLFIDLLVHKRKVIGMKRLVEMYTVEPAKLLGLSAGTLSVGAPGDVTVIDPGMEWVVDAGASFSRSRNTPFHGWELKGRAVRTVVDGETVWSL